MEKSREGCLAIPQLLSPLLFRLQLLSNYITWGTLSQNSPAVPFPNSLPTEVARGKPTIAVILSQEGLLYWLHSNR